MEVFLKGVYRNFFLTGARIVFRLVNRVLGQPASRNTMLQSDFFDHPPASSTTSTKLLKKCEDAHSDKRQLLTRSFHVVSGSTDSDQKEQRNGCIRVMQWNILADALGEGADNFIKCPSQVLKWKSRRLSCLQEILTYDPDVVCLQEVDHYEDFFKKHLERVGYVGTFNPKPDSPCLYCLHNNGPDGCAVFYKSKKFTLISSVSPILEVVERGQKWTTNQVAVLVRLRCNSPEKEHPKEFVVGTTHLKAKSSYQKLRYLQGLNLLAILEKQADKCPLIFGGDFNAEPTEKVYKAFENSKLSLKSVNKLLSDDGSSEPPYTTWKIRPSGEMCHTIDYMWFTQSQLQPLRILQFPSGVEIGENRLPSRNYPSDHLSLVADFAFTL
ncbi:nocturnin-like isoform X1 [Asterias rubens]|uniref:nocturnin-like isoform X1 n=2 Tax=Asterias rubens TaxID=7604 RepID=UPI001454F113|nr:nocturnin-like isoform X1 [Asterias rubens]XP_033632220.1 nocturnin-like isoform X1 [Asterias rubens]